MLTCSHLRHYLAKQMLRGNQDMLKIASELPSLSAASQVCTLSHILQIESCCVMRFQVRVAWLASELESARTMLERVSVSENVVELRASHRPSVQFFISCLYLGVKHKATRWLQLCSAAFFCGCAHHFENRAVVCGIHARISRVCSSIGIGPFAHHRSHQKFNGSWQTVLPSIRPLSPTFFR